MIIGDAYTNERKIVLYLTCDGSLRISLRQEEIHSVHQTGKVKKQSTHTYQNIKVRARHLNEPVEILHMFNHLKKIKERCEKLLLLSGVQQEHAVLFL
jgi:hypothetical protein